MFDAHKDQPETVLEPDQSRYLLLRIALEQGEHGPELMWNNKKFVSSSWPPLLLGIFRVTTSYTTCTLSLNMLGMQTTLRDSLTVRSPNCL